MILMLSGLGQFCRYFTFFWNTESGFFCVGQRARAWNFHVFRRRNHPVKTVQAKAISGPFYGTIPSWFRVMLWLDFPQENNKKIDC
jgi:hypothetical protein